MMKVINQSSSDEDEEPYLRDEEGLISNNEGDKNGIDEVGGGSNDRNEIQERNYAESKRTERPLSSNELLVLVETIYFSLCIC